MNDPARWDAFEHLSDDAFAVHLDAVLGEMGDVLRAKRQSYGNSNLTAFGSVGVLIRAHDKMQRLIHMWQTGATSTAVGEDALDAWTDIMGYAALVLVAERAATLRMQEGQR